LTLKLAIPLSNKFEGVRIIMIPRKLRIVGVGDSTTVGAPKFLSPRESPHLEWKPNVVEERAIKKLIRFADDLKARLHISHISTAEAVSLVRKAKNKRVNITVETCPHYLTLTGKDMKKLGAYLKMNPPLKTAHDLKALWKGLRDGTVDLVTSEHASGERSEKEVGWKDIWKAWGAYRRLKPCYQSF
jgi:dihydroorotase-like cyclic amidohydrolase